MVLEHGLGPVLTLYMYSLTNMKAQVYTVWIHKPYKNMDWDLKSQKYIFGCWNSALFVRSRLPGSSRLTVSLPALPEEHAGQSARYFRAGK